jgi:Rrf2 family protein
VNISAKTEYACIALIELAVHHASERPLRAREIADAHGIPPQFLLQILARLKGAGLVTGTRGASGGYRLNRAPHEITLGEVVGVIEGQPDPPNGNGHTRTWAKFVLDDVWQRISSAEREILESLTLADLADETPAESDPMYYI